MTNLSSSVGRVVYGSVEQATLALDAVAEELASLEAELQGLQFILTLEQDGLGRLQSEVTNKTSARHSAGGAELCAGRAGPTHRRGPGRVRRVPRTRELVADVSVAQESIDGPDGHSINQGDVWTTELITSLSVVMDECILPVSPRWAPPIRCLTYQIQSIPRHCSCLQRPVEVESAVADYDAHVLTIQSAQSAVDDKQGEVDAAGVAVAL